MPGLLALAIAMGIGRFAFTPILPMMQADAGLSLAAGGWLASSNYVGYLFGAVAALHLRAPSAWMIRLGLLLTAVVTIAMALTEWLWAWLLLRFAAGVASAWVFVHVTTWGFPRPEVVFSGVGAGIAGAGLICLALLSVHADSDSAWILLGAASLAGSAWLWGRFTRRDPVRQQAHESFRWTGDAVRLAAAYCAFGVGYIIPATFLPAMARQFVGDPLYYAWSWPVFGAAAVASTLFAGRLRKRYGDRRVWIAGHLLMALGTGALAIEAIPAAWRTIFCALLVGGSFVVVTMSAVQVARALAKPETAASFIAAMTAAFAVGQIVGPLVVAWAEDFRLPLVLATGLLLTGALLLMNRAHPSATRPTPVG